MKKIASALVALGLAAALLAPCAASADTSSDSAQTDPSPATDALSDIVSWGSEAIGNLGEAVRSGMESVTGSILSLVTGGQAKTDAADGETSAQSSEAAGTAQVIPDTVPDASQTDGASQGEGEGAGTSKDEGEGAGGDAGEGTPENANTSEDGNAEDGGDSEELRLLEDAAGSFGGRVEGLEDLRLTVGQVLDAYAQLQEDPRYDYVSGIEYSYRDNALDERECTLTAFELHYLVDEDARATYSQDLSRAVDAAVSSVRDSGAQDDAETVLAACDAVQRGCVGASGSTSSLFTAYGCLVEGSAVGKGYADALYLVLDRLGIPCVVVHEGKDGAAGTSWNMVQVDGSWYHVDLYWDSASEADGSFTHVYCLVDDETMRQGGIGSWDGPAQVDKGYFDGVVGTNHDDRIAFAASLWKRLVEGGQASLDDIDVYRLTYSEVMEAYSTYLSGAYYGYVASHGATYLSTSTRTDDCIVTQLAAEYRLSADEVAAYADTVNGGVAQIVAGVDTTADPYYQVLAVHDWLVRNVRYDESLALSSHTAYAVFAYGTAVCEGYSYAFQLAMDALDIPCVTVRSADMDHQWNMVCLNGQWYHVDVTWDDSTPDRGYDGDISYDHFLRSDESMYYLGYYNWEGGYEAPSDYWG